MKEMDDKDWNILKTINEERNLTKAGERLFITQPALTYRLRNLEKEFGAKLLNRYSNGVSFTPQGECVLRLAEEMLEKLQITKNQIRTGNAPVSGPLSLGISTVFAKFKIAPILKAFTDRFPDVQVSLQTGSSTSQLPDMLRTQAVDVAIIRGDFDWPEIKHVILEEPFCIVSARSFTLEQLPAFSWIQYETATLTKMDQEYDRWWQELFNTGRPPIIKVDSLEACIQLVSHNMGWTILPKIHVGSRRSLFLHPVIWKNGQPMLKRTVLAYKKNALSHPAAKAFIDYILNEGIR